MRAAQNRATYAGLRPFARDCRVRTNLRIRAQGGQYGRVVTQVLPWSMVSRTTRDSERPYGRVAAVCFPIATGRSRHRLSGQSWLETGSLGRPASAEATWHGSALAGPAQIEVE